MRITIARVFRVRQRTGPVVVRPRTTVSPRGAHQPSFARPLSIAVSTARRCVTMVSNQRRHILEPRPARWDGARQRGRVVLLADCALCFGQHRFNLPDSCRVVRVRLSRFPADARRFNFRKSPGACQRATRRPADLVRECTPRILWRERGRRLDRQRLRCRFDDRRHLRLAAPASDEENVATPSRGQRNPIVRRKMKRRRRLVPAGDPARLGRPCRVKTSPATGARRQDPWRSAIVRRDPFADTFQPVDPAPAASERSAGVGGSGSELRRSRSPATCPRMPSCP